jgi:hypothetical protein
MKKNEAVSRALFELRCIAESLQAFGKSLAEDSPQPVACWFGDQVERVANELDKGMRGKRGKGPAQ